MGLQVRIDDFFLTGETPTVWEPGVKDLNGRAEEPWWSAKNHRIEMTPLGSAVLKLH